ncbi:MAG: hypothetical protein WBB24_17245 [Maribacter sp.]
MIRKIIAIIIFGILLMNCEGDLEQGNCDEGFFEQTDFEGRSYCLPIADEDDVVNTISDAENLINAY